VLAKTKVHLRSEDDNDDLVFSPISDFGFFSDKTRAKVNADIGRATVFIRFNVLISQAILDRSWRQINYERIMGADQYLVRWLRKILGLRFTYAAPSKTFNLKLSTIIESSGVSLYDRMSDNLKAVETALLAMPDIVARFHAEKSWGTHIKTGKGRVLTDAKLIVRPTAMFCAEQMKTNFYVNTLDDAVITTDGAVMVEPRRQDFASLADYQEARAAFETGRRIKTKPT
jgi:hypothetical protein